MNAFDLLVGMDYVTGSAIELALNAEGDPAKLREAARRLGIAAARLESPTIAPVAPVAAATEFVDTGTETLTAADVFANARLRAGPYE